LGVGVKMGIVDGGHAQSDDVIRCPETFADHEYVGSSVSSMSVSRALQSMAVIWADRFR
jgi:hypothetical protein